MSNNIFSALTWILKKHGDEPIADDSISPYMLNRWLSMSDASCAKVVNFTYNKWGKIFPSDIMTQCKFYRVVFGKDTRKIKYIKKPQIEKEEIPDDFGAIRENMEISSRELKEYDKMLEILGKSKIGA